MILAIALTALLALAAVVLPLTLRARVSAPWHLFAAILFCPAVLSWTAYFSPGRGTPPDPVWRAARFLVVNTRLSSAELTRPDLPTPLSARALPAVSEFSGKYLRAPHSAGQKILPTEVRDAPDLQPGANEVLMFFPAQSLGSALPYVNAGARLLICEESKPCGGRDYPVAAMLSADPGTVVVRVPAGKDDLDRIRSIGKPVLYVAAL